jgi:hypothetical protein
LTGCPGYEDRSVNGIVWSCHAIASLSLVHSVVFTV